MGQNTGALLPGLWGILRSGACLGLTQEVSKKGRRSESCRLGLSAAFQGTVPLG